MQYSAALKLFNVSKVSLKDKRKNDTLDILNLENVPMSDKKIKHLQQNTVCHAFHWTWRSEEDV